MTSHQSGMRQRTREQWISLLRTRGIRPEKSMGQNFLLEPTVVQEIVTLANVATSDLVVEVGPGLGMLTRELAATGARVVAIELDRDLKRFLDDDLKELENVEVVEQDALQVDISTLVGESPYKMVANLPYSTGTAIARRFLESHCPPTAMTLMLQREVAERMVAQPPDMSLLTLATQIHAEASLLMAVPPAMFHPPPRVDSAVVQLVLRDDPLVDEGTKESLFRLATLAFQRKRKTLGNGLAQGLGTAKAEVQQRLRAAGVDPMRRPETLSIPEWIAITRELGS